MRWACVDTRPVSSPKWPSRAVTNAMSSALTRGRRAALAPAKRASGGPEVPRSRGRRCRRGADSTRELVGQRVGGRRGRPPGSCRTTAGANLSDANSELFHGIAVPASRKPSARSARATYLVRRGRDDRPSGRAPGTPRAEIARGIDVGGNGAHLQHVRVARAAVGERERAHRSSPRGAPPRHREIAAQQVRRVVRRAPPDVEVLGRAAPHLYRVRRNSRKISGRGRARRDRWRQPSSRAGAGSARPAETSHDSRVYSRSPGKRLVRARPIGRGREHPLDAVPGGVALNRRGGGRRCRHRPAEGWRASARPRDGARRRRARRSDVAALLSVIGAGRRARARREVPHPGFGGAGGSWKGSAEATIPLSSWASIERRDAPQVGRPGGALLTGRTFPRRR